MAIMSQSDQSIGNIVFHAYSEIPEYLEKLKYSLDTHSGKNSSDISIIIHRAEMMPSKTFFKSLLENRIEFPLRGCVYAYDKHSDTYNILRQDMTWGVIDFTTHSTVWHVYNDNMPIRNMIHSLFLDPLSLQIPRHNMMICHGAAISSEDGATVLLGPSGTGKSTLSFLMSHEKSNKDIKHMSDDTIVLESTDDKTFVYPIGTGFGISDMLADKYNVMNINNILDKQNDKMYFKTVPNIMLDVVPLKNIILLNKCPSYNGTLSIRELSSSDSLKEILDSQTSITNPYINKKLQMLMRLSKKTTIYSVKYQSICDPQELINII